MRQNGLLAGEVAISKKELARLHDVEVSHDHYTRVVAVLSGGSEAMRQEADKGSEYAAGWLACLRLLYNTIVREH